MADRRRQGGISDPRHGEVWWLEDEGIGRRPVLVLTRDSAIAVLSRLVVAPVTRTVRDIPSEVALDQDDGMPERCAATFDNLRTVSKSLLNRRITRLPTGKAMQVCTAMRFALDC